MSGGADDLAWDRLPAVGRPYAEVIGDPISQSKSPQIHNFWLAKLGIDAEYRAAHVRADQLNAYFAARKADPLWHGCNVTMPHKQAVISFMDPPVDGAFVGETVAARVGAVNTVARRRDRTLVGLNTDVFGFYEPLQKLEFRFASEQRVLMIGNGGAARAVLVRLDDARAASIQPVNDTAKGAITVAVRVPAKGRTLLKALTPGKNYDVADLAAFAELAAGASPRFDLVVNTSPLGMNGQPPLEFDLSHVTPGGVVYDIVTAPVLTPLLSAARDAGLHTIDGLAMLTGQAAQAFEFFFGQHPPRQHDAELRALLTS